MTSSICSFMNSFLGFWSELTNCKYIWLLFLPEALHPLGNMPVPWVINAAFLLLNAKC